MVDYSPNRSSLTLSRHPSQSYSYHQPNSAPPGFNMPGMISPPSVSRPSAGAALGPGASTPARTAPAPRPRSNLFSRLKREAAHSGSDVHSHGGATGGKADKADKAEKAKKRWTKRASRKPPPPPVRDEADGKDGVEDSPEFDFELDWERIRTLPRVRLVPPEDEGEPIMLYPIPHPSSLLPSASQALYGPGAGAGPTLLSATIAASSECTDPSAFPYSSPPRPVCPPDGVTPNSLAHATFASSQHSHWVGMSDQFILPPPVFSRRASASAGAHMPGGAGRGGRGAPRGIVMPKTRRQVEADIGKRMSMVQHRKRESLEILRTQLLPPLEEAAQSPPNVMLPPLEDVEDASELEPLSSMISNVGESRKNVDVASQKSIIATASTSESTATIRRVPVPDPARSGVPSPELPGTILDRQHLGGGAPQLGLGEPFELITAPPPAPGPMLGSAQSTAYHLPDAASIPNDAASVPAPAAPISDIATTDAPAFAPMPISSTRAPQQVPADAFSTRKKRSLSLSAALARSKSDQATHDAIPALPSTTESGANSDAPAVRAPKMRKQRSLKKLFFPGSTDSAPVLSASVPPVPALSVSTVSGATGKRLSTVPAAGGGAIMSPISSMNRETAMDSAPSVGASSTAVGMIKNVRARSKSLKSRAKGRPELVIQVQTASPTEGSFSAISSGGTTAEPEPITPALTTASTDIHSATVIGTPEQERRRMVDSSTHGNVNGDKGESISITKRFSLGNMSAAFKRKSSVPNISTAAALGSEDASARGRARMSGVPAVPALPTAYRKEKGKSGESSTMAGVRSQTLSQDKRGSAAWPVRDPTPFERRRSFDTLPASESTFPPTILQLLPSPSIRPVTKDTETSSTRRHETDRRTSRHLPTVRDSRLIELERDRTSDAEYRDKRRGSRFDFDFGFSLDSFEHAEADSTEGRASGGAGSEMNVSPKTNPASVPISPALASSDGACLQTSPGGQSGTEEGHGTSSRGHSSRFDDTASPGNWAIEHGSTESGQRLLPEDDSEEEFEPDAVGQPPRQVRGPADPRSRSLFQDDDSDDDLAESESTSIVHAQILPVSPTTRRAPYESMQRHLSSVAASRVPQVTQVGSAFGPQGKRQSVHALVLGSASVDGHSELDSILSPAHSSSEYRYGMDAHGPRTAGLVEGKMRHSMASAIASAQAQVSAHARDPGIEAAATSTRAARPHPVVPRRGTEPVVKMAAPMVIDLRGQYARRLTQPTLRTGSMPAPSAPLCAGNATSSPTSSIRAASEPERATRMAPVMVPLKDDTSTAYQPTARRSSEEIAELASQRTAVHVVAMARGSTDSQAGSETWSTSMSRSDSASSGSTQVIPTTPSSLALLRMMEPDAFALDDLSDSEEAAANATRYSRRFGEDDLALPDATLNTNDHTCEHEHDSEMDRLAAEIEEGDVNVEVAIQVSHSIIMGSTISASDIASMAHIASLVESSKSADSAHSHRPSGDACSPGSRAHTDSAFKPYHVAVNHDDPEGEANRNASVAGFVQLDDMSDSSSMVLVDSPSIPPEWLNSITPPTQDKRARSNPLGKGMLRGMSVKAAKANTYKEKGKGKAAWDSMAVPVTERGRRQSEQVSWQDRAFAANGRSPTLLTASPELRGSPASLGSNGTGGSTPRSSRFPSPEALLRLLHSPRSRRASADIVFERPSTAFVAAPEVASRGAMKISTGVPCAERQVKTDPVRTRPLPHIEGLPRACEVERAAEQPRERWTMLSEGLQLSAACFDALGLDLSQDAVGDAPGGP